MGLIGNPTMTEEVDVSLVVLYSIFSSLVLVSNGIVVLVVVKSRQLHMPTLLNIAFMAAWDFAFGLFFLCVVVPSKVMNEFAYSEKLSVPASVLLSMLIDQNILNILVALVDRYISISYPLRYPRLMSSRRFVLAAASVFSINLTRSCFVLLTDPNVMYYPRIGVCISTNTFDKISSTVIILVSCIIVVCLLVTLLFKLWNIRRGSISMNRIRSTQFTLTICLSTIVFFACFLPVGVAVVVGGIAGKQVPEFLVKFAMTCVLSNSLWNVYVYTFTYKPFKDAVLKLFFPAISRKRARRSVQMEFQRNRISTVVHACESIP